MRSLALATMVLLATAACARDRPRTAKAPPADWRKVATRSDMERLHDWREAFVKALNAATIGGSAARIASEGALLQPDTALDGSDIPPGRYRCRTIKLGAQAAGGLPYVAYPAFDCLVRDEGEVASITKSGGSQRPVGLIFSGDTRRSIFLGTMMLGDERTPLEYGRDRDRDMAGAVERIGPARWRMVLPYPRFESILDVVELTPAAS